MGAFVFMPYIQKRASDFGYVIFCLLLGGSSMLLFIYCLIAIWKSRIEIYSDRIRDIGPFKSTEILIKDVKGFKILPTQYIRTLLIVSNDLKPKKIEIGLLLDNQKDFLDWVNQNFKNLDVAKVQEEMNLILQDNQFGETEAERKSKFENARISSKILNGCGFIVAIWVMFWPSPYMYAILGAIVMPFICLIVIYYYKGLIKLNAQRGSAYFDASGAFILPSLALAMRASNDWHILNWNNFWSPFVEVLLILIFLEFLLVKDFRQNIGTAILITIFCGVYAYGGVITLNGIFDQSTPAVFRTQIAGKRFSSGRHTTYYFKLLPWGPKNITEDVNVGRNVYNKYAVGNTVYIYLKKGRVGINWFYIKEIVPVRKQINDILRMDKINMRLYVDDIFILADRYIADNRLVDADRLLQVALEVDNGRLDYQLKHAKILLALGHQDEAVEKARIVSEYTKDSQLKLDSQLFIQKLGVTDNSVAMTTPECDEMTIVLVPMGNVNMQLLNDMIPNLEKIMGIKFIISSQAINETGLPSGNQLDADKLIQILSQNFRVSDKANFTGYLGVTEHDLNTLDTNFVFGEAGNGYGVFSYSRYIPQFNWIFNNNRLLVERTVKQAVSSSFLLLNIPRGTEPMSIRSYAHNLAEHDAKPLTVDNWSMGKLDELKNRYCH